eukprot:CAMPEP_0195300620 /NCGR_PEP_ID=MMETSP0707-20130614/27825_1 /TAXON_ID=33640 /ORGANISM="Asterionellopsis glacialis, Strain CCMP134" /LENGTH=171 /DNA_ID=CAMNT_0040363371 /DNA_START=67 /DNA_END=582 /DNA_ORIENTATION=+
MNITNTEQHRQRRHKLLENVPKKRTSDSSLSGSFRSLIMGNLRGEELDSNSDVSSHSLRLSKAIREDDFWEDDNNSLLVACRDVIDNVTNNLKAEIDEGIARSISRHSQSSSPDPKSDKEQQADAIMSLAREDFAKTIKNNDEFHKLQQEIRAKGATTSAAVKRISLARGA